MAFDGVEFDNLNEALLELIEAKPAARWVIAFDQVEHTGSALLGVMVNIRQRVRATDGQLILCGLSPRLLDILRACSMERLFVSAKSRDEALSPKAK